MHMPCARTRLGEKREGDMVVDAFSTPLDLVALAYFLLAIGIYRMVAGTRSLEARSLIGAVQAQRVRWMLNMAKRDNRMLDAILLAIGIYRMVAGTRSLEARSLIGAVQAQRVRWMLNMAKRDNRMLDAIL